MEKHQNKNIIISLAIIIVIILGALCLLFATGTLSFNADKDDKNKQDENVPLVESIKNDESKDYVYDASYSTNNKYTEFNRLSGTDATSQTRTISTFGIDVEYTEGMQYLSNLKVPYINIKSQDADTVNNEMKALYEKNAEQFDKCAEEATNSANPSCSQILTYKTYQYNNILSVVVIESMQETSQWVLDYTIYNFDLEDGSKLSYSELSTKLGYDLATTATKAKDLIKNKINDLYGEYVDDFTNACSGGYDSSTDSTAKINCYDKANNIFDESINDNSILCFSDNNGNLNLLVIPYYDGVQNGGVNHYLLTINK